MIRLRICISVESAQNIGRRQGWVEEGGVEEEGGGCGLEAGKAGLDVLLICVALLVAVSVLRMFTCAVLQVLYTYIYVYTENYIPHV